MTAKISWGILGCGGIANKFAADLALTKEGQLVAVGSRSMAKAEEFAARHNAPAAYGSYEELAADPDVDIIYIATPHSRHMDDTLLAIDHGKHVLCEKPIAMNAHQTRRMMAAAQKKGVFLMEGMWTRLFPAIVQLREWLDAGRIGDVLAVEADFGIRFNVGPEHRIFNPALGGGALLDLGIYPVSFASMVFGAQPEKIVSVVRKTDAGIDKHAVIAFEYVGSETAAVSTSSIVRLKNEARIFGTAGMIILDDLFVHPDRITLHIEGQQPDTRNLPFPGYGFHYEAEHVHQCLRNRLAQSDIMPVDESLAIMQTMDSIRKQWKLTYPNE